MKKIYSVNDGKRGNKWMGPRCFILGGTAETEHMISNHNLIMVDKKVIKSAKGGWQGAAKKSDITQPKYFYIHVSLTHFLS